MLVAAVVFLVLATFVFSITKTYVRQASIVRATQLLDNTAFRISTIMNEVEAAADSAAWMLTAQLTPEAIIEKTRGILTGNSHFHSCSVSMEPGFFSQYGRFFSIYSVKEGDSIYTAQYGNEGFSYFEKDWYRLPKQLKRGCWIDPFLNVNPLSDYTPEVITSYSRPVYNAEGKFVGVIAIDLLQKWFSQTVTAVAPYPHSSSIMIGSKGNYLVHPDTAKLIRQTIFSDPDPRAREDVVLLGRDMIDGKSGMRQLVVDGQDAYIFFRPVGRNRSGVERAGTGWSMAIVCPESDVFSGYNHLLYTVWIIIAVGLLVILFVSYQTVRRAVIPLKLLERQASHIAIGHLDDILPETSRSDTIGQLQNSFVEMQQSLVKYVNDIRQMNEDLEQRNQEQVRANELVREASRKKTAFVQDMMHQIRTPLNIISGFVQVLEENFHELPDDETKNIISMMQDNSKKISRIVRLLVSASEAGTDRGAIPLIREPIGVAALCHEVAETFQPTNPGIVKFNVVTRVSDELTIHSDRESIKHILTELLDNANKFTQKGSITLECSQPDSHTVCFAVSDTGIGIAADDRERIFGQFTKVSYFTEGVGLGLSLSKRAAQTLGGDLQLDTSYQGGARLVLTLNIE
jgi:signal transduction histidine kinase